MMKHGVNVPMIQFIKTKKLKRSNEIDYISKCLSQQTIAAETMVNYMYELVNGTNIIYRDLLNRDKKEEDKRDSDITYITEKINIEKRMDLLSQNKQESFSGNIDDLIQKRGLYVKQYYCSRQIYGVINSR